MGRFLHGLVDANPTLAAILIIAVVAAAVAFLVIRARARRS
jgi:hypothetical protein